MASILTFRRLVWNVLCAYFLLQKKEIQDSNCPNLDTKKLQLPPLSNTWPLRKHFNQVCYVEECFFLRKKIDRFWADTANPDTPRSTYFLGSISSHRNITQESSSYIGQSQTIRSQAFTVLCEHLRFLRLIELCGCQSSS